MNQSHPRHRRVVRDLGRAGVAVSAAMLVLTFVSGPGRELSVSAATNGGALSVQIATGPTAGQPLTSGGSATSFALRPPSGASCTGDSASGNYRVQSYMVPASVSPETLKFDAGGPTPQGTGTSYRQPLFANGTGFINELTGLATTANGPGLLVSLPPFDFNLFGADGPSIVPPGTYNLGYACTVGTGASQVLDKYWNAQFTFATNANDVPSKITWTVVAGSATTTTTTAAAATTTTAAGATTTAATDTTAVTDTTGVTDTSDPFTSSTDVGSGFPDPGTDVGSGGGTLVSTGASPAPFILWGVLLLIFGRMAILTARPVRVLTDETR